MVHRCKVPSIRSSPTARYALAVTLALACALSAAARGADRSGAPVVAAPRGAQRAAAAGATATAPVPIYVAMHWHMHQPIYWPGEDIVATSRNPQNTLDVLGILSWPDRVGAYTRYPVEAVSRHAGLPHFGVQISFSGSLIEDLDAMAAAGITYGKDWASGYRSVRGLRTVLGNPRMDLVAFGYFHPLMAFLTYDELRAQIRSHREKIAATFGGPPSHGIFPPENAFTESMIPALADEGIAWAMVDDLHFDRACRGYPYTAEQKIPPPNPADQRNAPVGPYVNLHCQTNTEQAVSAFALRPHWVEYRDPSTGQAVTPGGRPARIIAVPTERSIGYDDSYGDRSPVSRLDALAALNTDPRHPLLIVMAHDGDNFGASGSRYYLETLQWVEEHSDRVMPTTVQDYLDQFPPDAADVIHVEDGAWPGADLGDADFSKWLGPPVRAGVVDPLHGYSSDWDSWASIVAARNWVEAARALRPDDPATLRAQRALMVGETSCYWYWDGTAQWDQKPTLAANQAVEAAREALGAHARDPVAAGGPSIFPPWRFPYNPGMRGPGGIAPSTFQVYTLVGAVSPIESVTLRVKSHPGREVSPADLTYAGEWTDSPMTLAPMGGTGPLPALAKAGRYVATVAGQEGNLVSYCVRATDVHGHQSQSSVKVVAVSEPGQEPGPPVPWTPAFPRSSDLIEIHAPHPATLHWGVNGWQAPPRALWPPGTTPWTDGRAVETPMAALSTGESVARLGPVAGLGVDSIQFVWHFTDGTWGRDQEISIAREPTERFRTYPLHERVLGPMPRN